MDAANATAYAALPHARRTRTAKLLATAGLPVEILARRSDAWIMEIAKSAGARDAATIIAAVIAADAAG